MVVEYQMPNPDKATEGALASGLLSATYDVGGDGEAPNKFSTLAFEGGFVGFRWHRVKFQCKQLRITGILDKKKAVEMLRAKLKAKKPAAAATTAKKKPTPPAPKPGEPKPEAPPEKEGEPAGSPTASGDKPEGSKEGEGGKKIDF